MAEGPQPAHQNTAVPISPENGQPDAAQQATNLRGITLIIIAMGAFVLNDTLTKATSTELPIGQIIALRGLFACLLMMPIVALSTGFSKVLQVYSIPILVRNASEIAAVILFLNALFRLPLANVTAIMQTLPLTMTAAAAILLKERVGWRRWSAASVGLIGILLVVRPGTSDFSWWYVSAIVCVFFVTARDVATRFIPTSTPSIVVTFITAAVVTCAGLALGFTETWVMPSTPALIRLAGAAVMVLVGYYTMIECWRGTEISVVAPFRYSVVLWAMAFGYIFLGEVPTSWTVIGSAILVCAGIYTFHRERQIKKS